MVKNELQKIQPQGNALEVYMQDPQVQEQFRTVLKENSTSFMASIVDVFNNSTDLQKCEVKDIMMEALKAASLKLPLSRSLGYGYIIPFKGKPQFQMGYKGYIQLALRSNQYEVINADVVYEGELSYKDKLRGIFKLEGEATSDKVIGYFAHIVTKGGFEKTLFSTEAEIRAHAKKYSQSYGSTHSPWTNSFDEMAIKTVLKTLLSKYGSLSIELETAFQDDVEDEIKNNANTIDVGFKEIKHEEKQDGKKANEEKKKPEPKF